MRKLLIVMAMAALAGCATSYSFRPTVPDNKRTIAVPTFRNETEVNELGAVCTAQILREFQREGTFKIRRAGDSAIEVQGTIRKANSSSTAYNRRTGLRINLHEMTVEAVVSVIDKQEGKVLAADRVYRASASYTAGQDMTTAMRDASGRVADELSRQIVDEVVRMKFEQKEETK